MPRVMNVDKNPAYPAAVEALRAEGVIPGRVTLRQCKYLNNVIEQDHRTVKKRVWLAKGYGSFQSAWRTLQGIETVHMIRKGRVRWLRQKGIRSAKLSSSAGCSASLPNLIRPLDSFCGCEIPSPKLRNETGQCTLPALCTILLNVPLNNALSAVDPASATAAPVWARFKAWTSRSCADAVICSGGRAVRRGHCREMR